ncbi:unnamed protein product, partial [Timema podura]|nr:unnamed protein product [Timema podura]
RFRFGLDGHACVLRTICETAASATVKELGVSAELLHVMFTPSSTDEVSNDLWQREYVSAEHVGNKRETACAYFYPECSVSLLDLISKSNLTSSTVETKD